MLDNEQSCTCYTLVTFSKFMNCVIKTTWGIESYRVYIYAVFVRGGQVARMFRTHQGNNIQQISGQR